MSIAIAASAAAVGSGDLIVGLVIGVCIGFLIGPVVRSWLIVREWAATSRQARLADQILSRMGADAGIGDTGDPETVLDDQRPRTSWRTLP